MSTFVVTGCAGFIGSHLAEALLERGDGVIGIDVFTDYYARSTKEANLRSLRRDSDFTLIEVDLTEADLGEVFAGIDGVFHLAAQPGVRGSWGETFETYARDNVLATQRVCEAAAGARVRLVWASSSSVYGNAEAYPTSEDTVGRPVSPYGVTKLACELLTAAYRETFALDAVALRYFTVYGPRQRPDMAFSRIVDALVAGRTFDVYGTGEQTRDVTYVGDAVDATLAAMERAPSGAVYNLGGGSEVSLLDAIRTAERLSGRMLALRHTPAAAGDVRRTSADTRRAAEELDWAPRVSFEQGIAAQLVDGGIEIAASAS